jgi:hypothetical protein
MLFEEIFEKWGGIEVILDRAFAAAGDNDDVLDARGYALFSDILDLWLVDNRQHFFRLGFGRRQEARAQAGGR